MLGRTAAFCWLAAAAVLAAACGSPGYGTASSGGGGTGGSAGNTGGAAGAISTRQLSGIGTALVNSSGMTIYTPQHPQETNRNIKCTGACLSFWLPVTASPASLRAVGGLPGTLATIPTVRVPSSWRS